MITERPYTSDDKPKSYFVGTEVENTPCKNQKTLFVIGVRRVDEIVKYAHDRNVVNIYIGANQSYHPKNNKEREQWFAMILGLLKSSSVCVTFDMPALELQNKCVQKYLENIGRCYPRFVLMVSVKIPHVKNLNCNTTIKIDDIDFQATNTGVWCERLENIMQKKNFTGWDQYTQDEAIK